MDTPQKAKIAWLELFAHAADAYLNQMPLVGKLVFIDRDGGQHDILDEAQNFAVVALSGQVLKGYNKWGLGLPTIKKTLPTKKDKP